MKKITAGYYTQTYTNKHDGTDVTMFVNLLKSENGKPVCWLFTATDDDYCHTGSKTAEEAKRLAKEYAQNRVFSKWGWIIK
jgi:hypothetical protein